MLPTHIALPGRGNRVMRPCRRMCCRADEIIEYRTKPVAMHESPVGTKRTSSDVRGLVAIRGKADVARIAQFGREGPNSDMTF